MKALNGLTSRSRCFIVSLSSELAFSRKTLVGWTGHSPSWLLIGGSLDSLTGEVMDLPQLVDTDMLEAGFDNCTPDSISQHCVMIISTLLPWLLVQIYS